MTILATYINTMGKLAEAPFEADTVTEAWEQARRELKRPILRLRVRWREKEEQVRGTRHEDRGKAKESKTAPAEDKGGKMSKERKERITKKLKIEQKRQEQGGAYER